MVGRGWFIIYGLLLLVVVFMFFSQLSTNAEVDRLKQEVAGLKGANQPSQEATDSPSPEPSPSSSAATTPDLSTPENRDTKRKADLEQTRKALADYFDEKKSYPVDRKELTPKYLPVIPVDPLNPKYTYRYKKTISGFELTCALETKSDTDDARDGKKDQIYTVTNKSTARQET